MRDESESEWRGHTSEGIQRMLFYAIRRQGLVHSLPTASDNWQTVQSATVNINHILTVHILHILFILILCWSSTKFKSFFTWLSMIGKILPLFYFLRVPILPALMLKKIMLETKWYHISHSVVVYRKPFDRFDNMQNKEWKLIH